jgi:hypothetical protein
MIKQFNRPDMIYKNNKYKVSLYFLDISLSKFLFDYITPDLVRKYDYIIIILDDVEIKNIELKIEDVIEAYERSRLNILSPSVEEGNWLYIHPRKGAKPREIRVVNGGLEFFCYLMNPKSYEIYYKEVLVPWNDYMWGCDLILEYAGLKVGIYDFWTSRHYYRSLSENNRSKEEKMHLYLKQFFKGKEDPNIFRRVGTLREIITV